VRQAEEALHRRQKGKKKTNKTPRGEKPHASLFVKKKKKGPLQGSVLGLKKKELQRTCDGGKKNPGFNDVRATKERKALS